MSSFALTDKERDALMEQVYGGYNRSPIMTRGNKATQGADRMHSNAGKIDYYTYGGDASRDYNDKLYAKTRDSKHYNTNRKSYGDYFDKYEKRNKNRDTWKRVADHLGIDKVEDERDLRKMYDFVTGYKAQKNEESKDDKDPGPLLPRGERVPRFNQSAATTPGMSRRGVSDASMAAIRGGDDLNEWYQTKFVPHLEADAMATTSEIGDDSRYFLSKFAFDPPELGSVKEIFDRYKGEIEDLD